MNLFTGDFPFVVAYMDSIFIRSKILKEYANNANVVLGLFRSVNLKPKLKNIRLVRRK